MKEWNIRVTKRQIVKGKLQTVQVAFLHLLYAKGKIKLASEISNAEVKVIKGGFLLY
jgi:hypothetical protein